MQQITGYWITVMELAVLRIHALAISLGILWWEGSWSRDLSVLFLITDDHLVVVVCFAEVVGVWVKGEE